MNSNLLVTKQFTAFRKLVIDIPTTLNNLPTNFNRTLLLRSCSRNHFHVCEHLTKYREYIDVGAVDTIGWNIYDFASWYGNTNIMYTRNMLLMDYIFFNMELK